MTTNFISSTLCHVARTACVAALFTGVTYGESTALALTEGAKLGSPTVLPIVSIKGAITTAYENKRWQAASGDTVAGQASLVFTLTLDKARTVNTSVKVTYSGTAVSAYGITPNATVSIAKGTTTATFTRTFYNNTVFNGKNVLTASVASDSTYTINQNAKSVQGTVYDLKGSWIFKGRRVPLNAYSTVRKDRNNFPPDQAGAELAPMATVALPDNYYTRPAGSVPVLFFMNGGWGTVWDPSTYAGAMVKPTVNNVGPLGAALLSGWAVVVLPTFGPDCTMPAQFTVADRNKKTRYGKSLAWSILHDDTEGTGINADLTITGQYASQEHQYIFSWLKTNVPEFSKLKLTQCVLFGHSNGGHSISRILNQSQYEHRQGITKTWADQFRGFALWEGDSGLRVSPSSTDKDSDIADLVPRTQRLLFTFVNSTDYRIQEAKAKASGILVSGWKSGINHMDWNKANNPAFVNWLNSAQ